MSEDSRNLPDDLKKELEKLHSHFQSVQEADQIFPKEQESDLSFQKDGFWSWVACWCAVMNQLLIFGTLNVYSLFMVKFQKEFHCSTAEAAWLGSMTMGLMKLFGPLSSSLAVHLENRVVMILGALMCTLSIFASSFAPTFTTLFGTLCVPFALGSAFTITPSMMVPVEYFQEHQSVAMGFVAAGSSMGTLILAPLIQIMLDSLNWRLTFRIHSATMASLVLFNCMVKPRKRPKQDRATKKPFWSSIIEDLALWKNRVFQLWAVAMAIVYFGYQIPNILLASYAGFIGISASRASYIVMTMGGATTVSRLITGKILTCRLLSRLHFKQTIFVIMGTSYLLLAHVTTIEGLYVFAVVRGLLDGAHIVMLPMLTASMVGQNNALLGWGYIAGAISLTYTLGPPVAGYVKDMTGDYKMSFTMAGLPMIASGLLLFWLPWAQRTAKVASLMETIDETEEEDMLGDESEESLDKRRRSKIYHPIEMEVLELMPLDVPDIKMSVVSSRATRSRDVRKKSESVRISSPASQELFKTFKSRSLPETRKHSISTADAMKIKSEPVLASSTLSSDFTAAKPLSARRFSDFIRPVRHSGPMVASIHPDNESVCSHETSYSTLKNSEDVSQETIHVKPYRGRRRVRGCRELDEDILAEALPQLFTEASSDPPSATR